MTAAFIADWIVGSVFVFSITLIILLWLIVLLTDDDDDFGGMA